MQRQAADVRATRMQHRLAADLYLRAGEPALALDWLERARPAELADIPHPSVHRDFKAGNVILGDDGRLKIVDFGLARRDDALMAGVTTLPSLVPAGHAAGTPYAMAPEQVRGNRPTRSRDCLPGVLAAPDGPGGA